LLYILRADGKSIFIININPLFVIHHDRPAFVTDIARGSTYTIPHHNGPEIPINPPAPEGDPARPAGVTTQQQRLQSRRLRRFFADDVAQGVRIDPWR